MEMGRCLMCSLIWLNFFLAFRCLEALANVGKASLVIISYVGSLKFKALVLIGAFVREMGTTSGRWRDLNPQYFYLSVLVSARIKLIFFVAAVFWCLV